MKNIPEPPQNGEKENGRRDDRFGASDRLKRLKADDIEADDRPVLITGGAGFVGTNLADRLLTEGRRVILFDNLSRDGVAENARFLQQRHGPSVQLVLGDIREASALKRIVPAMSAVYHLAAQVAVTTSLDDPTADFEVNARGTLNLLEALRGCSHPPPLLFTSTNKIYGALPNLDLRENDKRYEPVDDHVRSRGVAEAPLDFHSPYGCSKGAADQYVLDYARTFGIRAVVFRMSCIYGPHQFGTEDQGWVAHFLLQALAGEPITIYGDGRQVRDALFVEDLVDAMLLATDRIDQLNGRAFNIGGGPANTLSLLELLDMIARIQQHRPAVLHEDWRPGDQRYYVSDTSRFQNATGWKPRTSIDRGLRRLYECLATGRRAAPRISTQTPTTP